MNIRKGVFSNLKNLWGVFLILFLFVALFASNQAGFRWVDKHLFTLVTTLINDEKVANDFYLVDTGKHADAGEAVDPEIQLAAVIKRLSKAGPAAMVLVDEQIPSISTPGDDAGDLVKRIRDVESSLKGKRNQNSKKALQSIRQNLGKHLASDNELAHVMKRNNVVLALPLSNQEMVKATMQVLDVKWEDGRKPLGVYLNDIPVIGLDSVPVLQLSSMPRDPGYRIFPVYENTRDEIYRPLVWRSIEAHYQDLVSWLFAKLEGSEALAWQEATSMKYLSQTINTDHAGRIIPLQSSVTSAGSNISLTSLSSVQAGKLPDLKGKVVLIGNNHHSRLADIALAVNSMRAGTVYYVPAWAQLTGLLLPVAIFLYFILVIPRMAGATEFILALFILFAVLTAGFALVILKGQWIPLASSVMFLFTGHVTSLIKKVSDRQVAELHEKLHDTNWSLAEILFDKGEYSQAFESLKNCDSNNAVLEKLYRLGLEFERQREYDRAREVFHHLKAIKPGFKDVEKRILSLTNVNGEQPAIISPFSGEKTLVMSDSDIEKPVIGRYELVREIGRGEMGIVYLGKDPKINREVAIKTLNFVQFEKGELETVKQRFFREAETAGKLSHPNIVTIYDVGDERDLAFIAMDYVPGKDMSAFVQKDTLLPVSTVLESIIKVADALDYAHRQGVVHRDIKPGNIIYHEEEDLIKVTDFGIARIMDTANTRTGTILGSPAYMSPEQLAGKKVEGTADLFSLGATLYQLLVGEFPFKGDSIAALAYKIANERHKPIRDLRPELPKNITRVINKALNKEAGKRFATGKEMKDALQKILDDL